MRTPLFISFALFGLSACASLEPDPCSPDWVEWKTSQILVTFTQSNVSDLDRLRQFSQRIGDGDIGPLTALRMPEMIELFKDLALSFRDEALPQLNAAAAQCGSPKVWLPAFTEWLEREGLDTTILEWVALLQP